MKIVSNEFKNKLKSIKEMDAIISYADRDHTNFIITQNSEFLVTQVEDFLVTESAEIIIDNNGIKNSSIYWNMDPCTSVCKMLDLETDQPIPKGTEINVRIGILVDNNYEYVDYGKFYIVEEAKYQLGSQTYITTAYDRMINFNIKASENPLTFEEGVTYTLKEYLQMICNKCGVLYSFNFETGSNANKAIIDKDYYENKKDITYRSILNDIAASIGTNFMINENNKITNKDFKNRNGQLVSGITIDGDVLRSKNVYIGEKKEPITGIQVYDGSTMINYAGSDASVFKIKDNNIMSAHSSVLLSNVLDKLQGLYYYTYQLDTYGIFIIEPIDFFTVNNENTDYLLCSFHNDIKIGSSVSENISYDFTKFDSVSEYTTSSSEDKLSDAFIEIDKSAGQMVLKATNNGKIVQAKLNADPEEGSSFDVQADNINFSGKEFNITTENMKISLGTGSNKKELINTSGLMTAFIIQGNVISSSFVGGTCMLPMGYSQTENSYAKDRLEFDFVLPAGFVVDKAYVTLSHIPSLIYFNYGDASYGYCRNMRLYKATSYSGSRMIVDLNYFAPLEESGVTYQGIYGIFNGGDFTGNSGAFSSETSSDISGYISTSSSSYTHNKFKVETTDGLPSSINDMMSRNGCLQGTMTIIGHMSF